MADKHLTLTSQALMMMDAITRNGSFAPAARELGRVPSALTRKLWQLEKSLDVLLFDRRSGQAWLTAAGQKLLYEGRRLLAEMAGTWEALLSGQADLTLGIALNGLNAVPGVAVEPLGELPFVLSVSPSHQLTRP
ncbi:MAG: LysR family transcriptional regulator [Betaproteobacteria bacterium]|nr:LysR family transcriptional regulator [Betaproteobacteria bacterium]